MPKLGRLLAALALLVSVAGCGGVSTPSNEISEDFSGTIDPFGQAFQSFSVGKTGEMQVTLATLVPRPVVGFLALAIGSPVSNICSPLPGYAVQQAAIGQQYALGQITKGSYCVLVADANGVLTQPASFTVRFVHP